MKKQHRQKVLLNSLFLIATLIISCNALGQNNDSENAVVRLGNPLRNDGITGRALNVWDLQAFGQKIYIAGGSTVTNAGPINVWAYDPSSQKFVKEYTVDEEAIEHYKVFNEQLYIPAADPTVGDLHKFYRLKANSQWQKYASETVKLAHVRDLIVTDTNDILMVGNNRHPDKLSNVGTTIATATGDSISFSGAGVENIQINNNIIADYNWFFSVFEYQERIFATNSLLRDSGNFSKAIAEYNFKSKQFILRSNLLNDEFIPQSIISKDNKDNKYGFEVIYRPWNPVEFQNHLIYPVRSYSIIPNSYTQSYMNSIGFFCKSGMGESPQEVKLPNRAVGEDVLVVDRELYVLANKKEQDNKFTIYVYKTNRLDQKIEWQQVVKFSSFNKGRSFEYLDGTFYFGLGQDYGEAINSAGDILSYHSQ